MTELAEAYDNDRPIWILNAGATTIEGAITALGFNTCTLLKTDEQALWNDQTDAPTMRKQLDRMKRRNDGE
jgi:hypothetical protein